MIFLTDKFEVEKSATNQNHWNFFETIGLLEWHPDCFINRQEDSSRLSDFDVSKEWGH